MDAPNQSGASRDSTLSKLPDRFFSLEDVVSQELNGLDYPWNLGIIEERIREYSAFSDDINAQLSARVMRNYNDFVQGMQQVQSVETELTLVGVLIKNGRRKLKERDVNLVRGSMHITRQQRKKERLSRLLATLSEFQDVLKIDGNLRQCVHSENYSEAITVHADLREALARDQFKQFPGVLALREGLTMHHEVVKQKLSDGLRVAAVSASFDAERYEEILKAYSRLSSDVAPSVGKELLRHVSECIVSVSRQCMLAFSAAPPADSPTDWHRKAQLRDLCKTMDPTRFVACTAQLYEYLCDFLYRHQFLCDWHLQRVQVLEKQHESEPGQSGFHNVLRDVLTELSASKRNVWDRIQQQVSLVLMTLDFQYPALTEDSFLHILHLTQLLIEEGDAFMSTYQTQGAESRRQWSAPIRNTLRSKAHDYFQTLHFNAFVDFKIAHIEQDSWQRLPVPRSYRLLRKERLRAVPRTTASASQADASKASGSEEPTVQKGRTTENNPFRNYKPEPMLPSAATDDFEAIDARANREENDEFDEHALLQHWIDDSEGLLMEQIGSSMLSNSNRSPVVSSSTAELARILERYFRMMGAIPGLALEIFQSAVQVIEFYVHCVLCLFVQDKQLIMLLDELDPIPMQLGQPGYDIKLQSRHDTFLLQRTCPDLRRTVLRTREHMSSLTLPDGCAANLGVQGPVNGASLLQVQTFPKLTSPSSLCGLAERCVGVESVGALVGELRDLQSWLSTLLPRGSAQEAVERFLPTQEVIASQLKTFVLMCAARDVLEVPDVGRVSLEHFSNTVQALKWDVKDFSAGSPAQPYLEQLRAQIDELARRIPCAGGGSIPYATQRMVWGWAQVRIMRECAEVFAKIGKRKSQEALFRLAEDFQVLRDAVGQNFKSPNAAEDLPLLPDGHPLIETVSWPFLDQYLSAHAFSINEAVVWCKRHPEYPLRLLKALVDYVSSAGNPKVQKQALTDLETFFATYIADEQMSSSTQRPI